MARNQRPPHLHFAVESKLQSVERKERVAASLTSVGNQIAQMLAAWASEDDERIVEAGWMFWRTVWHDLRDMTDKMDSLLLGFLEINVCGLCDLDRKIVVHKWIASLHITLGALALQEVKADRFCLDIAFRTTLPWYQHFLSVPDEGRVALQFCFTPCSK